MAARKVNRKTWSGTVEPLLECGELKRGQHYVVQEENIESSHAIQAVLVEWQTPQACYSGVVAPHA